MINWILAYVAMVVYFLVRYRYRRYKTKFSFKKWWDENWNEFIVSILTIFLLMMLLLNEQAEFDLSYFYEKIPFIKNQPVNECISIVIGYLNVSLFYWIFKKKQLK